MSTFLDSLDPELREAMRLVGVTIGFDAGQSVFSRGDAGETIYVNEGKTQ